MQKAVEFSKIPKKKHFFDVFVVDIVDFHLIKCSNQQQTKMCRAIKF